MIFRAGNLCSAINAPVGVLVVLGRIAILIAFRSWQCRPRHACSRSRGREPEIKSVVCQPPINLKEEEESKPVSLAINARKIETNLQDVFQALWDYHGRFQQRKLLLLYLRLSEQKQLIGHVG